MAFEMMAESYLRSAAIVLSMVAILTGTAGVGHASVIARWTFDDAEPAEVRETLSGSKAQIHLVRGGGPERPSGITATGTAFRVEGWSSWFSHAPGTVAEPDEFFSVEGWLAVRAYPMQNDAAIVNKHAVPQGFFLGLDPYGRWNLSAGVGGDWRAAFANVDLPRETWIHLAGTLGADGMHLFLDGEQVGENLFANSGLDAAIGEPLVFGRHNSPSPSSVGEYPLGVFNGLLDDWRIHDRALSQGEVQAIFNARTPGQPHVLPMPDRYANDPQRPLFTPMPPSSWTNEPHGLTYWNGNYHIFYQANPNGNYLGPQQHWGHIWSPDLVYWNFEPEAIWPSPTFDRFGVWSGSTLHQGHRVAALYTSNAGGQSMSIAYSDDTMLKHWTKADANPVIGEFPPGAGPNLQGHRDPYVFEANGYVYVIIGGGYPHGGRVFLYRSQHPDLLQWSYRGEMYSAPESVAGTMWEMPQFFRITDDRWVFMVNTLPVARSVYWIGTFENERFIPDFVQPKLSDSARGVPGVPEAERYFMLSPSVDRLPDGRLWAVGVVIEDRNENDCRNAGYANAFSIPREYSLHPDGDKLRQRPLPELTALRGDRLRLRNFNVEPGGSGYLDGITATAFDVSMRVNMQHATSLTLRIRQSPDNQERTDIRFIPSSGVILIDRGASSMAGSVGKWNVFGEHELAPGETLDLRVMVDQSIVTVFANERTVLTTRIYPTRADADLLDLRASGGTAHVLAFDAWPMAGGGEVIPPPSLEGWIVY